MALTDTFVKQVKHTGRDAGDKYSDGGGLYLHVLASGKYWRLAYRFGGKQKTLALGVYPTVMLADARRAREAAKKLLAAGTDPSLAKRVAKATTRVSASNTFEAVATEYHATKAASWSPKYAERWLRLLRKDMFPYIGALPLAEITAPMVLDALRKAEKRGVLEVAHTLRQNAGQVFRYGVQTGRCERNPVVDLHGALQPIVVKHMAAVLEPAKAGELMRAIDGYSGQPMTRAALMLSALTFQRPGNIRAMEWTWISLDEGMLTIPPESMKRRLHQKINGRPHFVPLAPQAVQVLRELHPLTGHGRYVFPSLRTSERPMSENTVNAALRRLGFSGDDMSAHGFRAMARTLMVENIPGIDPNVIEAQLAHGKSGPLGAAYDRAEFMRQRQQMMATWADYLDKLRVGADVITLRRVV
ncbi:integrase arm-type DNA-binding domain-containing protein [Ottowia sp.]|uniref:tyrosine-type recombinase/integrase n=1 Tax=Ottowia sp. TaxID=1898956 RepID=UPI002C1DE3F4|nr:integrase arm-type DNA-binding domain-containing protein [Ottowia sp.]HRN77567.1 integrase arm-type DNA-binding domain-containing protein [Ottowia sp.]